MKKNIPLIFILVLFFNNIAFSFENKILFKVNNEIITSLDIFNEINYLNSINKNFKNLEKEKVYQIAKKSIIREKIKEIFLLNVYKKVDLNSKDFNKLIVDDYSYLGINNLDDLDLYLKQFGLSINSLKKKISVKTLWTQFIYNKYYNRININIDQIKNDILRNDKQKEFLMSEILFNLESNEILEDKYSIINKSIRENGFENSALIYSISETSKNGGKIGWVKENSINNKVLGYILKLKNDKYTMPIVVPGGFLILKLNDTRITTKDINLEKELETIIRTKTNDQLNQFSNIFLNKIKKEVRINEL